MPLPTQARTGHSALCLPYKHSNDGHDEVVVFGGGDNDGAFFQDLDFFMVPLEDSTHNTNTT
ncbi:hypothetical protein NP493_246g00014 [Ridgeia piscesae]|uniref:Uncharacterized protein n=1 Tax=Ridgeia piscesae TaxID=27915 RepID=A0AAD9UD40_RIDPI|nr:hypothetical protein NP493_246g00014 [Ridgeia piscesae]